jgi:hypothetical protein
VPEKLEGNLHEFAKETNALYELEALEKKDNEEAKNDLEELNSYESPLKEADHSGLIELPEEELPLSAYEEGEEEHEEALDHGHDYNTPEEEHDEHDHGYDESAEEE